MQGTISTVQKATLHAHSGYLQQAHSGCLQTAPDISPDLSMVKTQGVFFRVSFFRAKKPKNLENPTLTGSCTSGEAVCSQSIRMLRELSYHELLREVRGTTDVFSSPSNF